jgi:ribokinase
VAVRAAVVGHVEWVTHARGEMPATGHIAHLADAFDEPAGGAVVAAAQMARLGARCTLYTALGDDAESDRSRRILAGTGLDVVAADRAQSQPRALSVVGTSGERTILVTGGRLSPTIDDPLPWQDLARCAAVYFIGDDPRTVIAARAARHLVVSARRLSTLVASGVPADVIVASTNDPAEVVDVTALPAAPRALVLTEGGRGGRIVAAGRERRYAPAVPPGPLVDTYGAGDSFAGGLTAGLAIGLSLEDAVALGARCGATALTARGGLTRQLDSSAIDG